MAAPKEAQQISQQQAQQALKEESIEEAWAGWQKQEGQSQMPQALFEMFETQRGGQKKHHHFDQ